MMTSNFNLRETFVDKLYENSAYAVQLVDNPDGESNGEPIYGVVNQKTGVVEYYTNLLYEAKYQSEWLEFMLENWRHPLQEKMDGFHDHFAQKAAMEFAGKLPEPSKAH